MTVLGQAGRDRERVGVTQVGEVAAEGSVREHQQFDLGRAGIADDALDLHQGTAEVAAEMGRDGSDPHNGPA